MWSKRASGFAVKTKLVCCEMKTYVSKRGMLEGRGYVCVCLGEEVKEWGMWGLGAVAGIL